jgi:hypothetical protein
MRGNVRAWRAHDSGDQKEVEEAMADADAARAMVPNNPRALMVTVFSRVVAAGIYQEAKLPEKRAAVLQEAERHVPALEHFVDDVPDVVWPVYFFYREIGDSDKALKVVQRSFDRSKSPLAANFCSVELYLQGRFAEGVKCLDQRRHADFVGDIFRAFNLAELPGGRDLLLQEYEKRTATQRENEIWVWQVVLMFMGKKEQAVALCKVPAQNSNQSPDQGDWTLAWAQFASGELTEEKYITKAGSSRNRQVEAHFYIGLVRLATGDRVIAREHFHEVLGNRKIYQVAYWWTRMFLSRMEKDPTWPPWIPVKK